MRALLLTAAVVVAMTLASCEKKGTPSVKVEGGPAKNEAVATIYTCPMHPEVQQSSPGKCPKCGMALVPKTETAPASQPETK